MATTAKINIRPAHRDDLADIVAINQAGQESTWSERQFASALNGNDTLWVLTQNDQVAAFLLWHSVLDEAEIHHFGVATTALRRGLASQLLSQLVTHCRSVGIHRIILDVRAGNQAAKALYLKHGFVVNGQRTGYYQTATGREDALLMEKTC
ncbi:ribosomal protein S18-alanine N-acetyltransferase [Neisseriaceae bacterium CLB008]